jgi:hypothetical protein
LEKTNTPKPEKYFGHTKRQEQKESSQCEPNLQLQSTYKVALIRALQVEKTNETSTYGYILKIKLTRMAKSEHYPDGGPLT